MIRSYKLSLLFTLSFATTTFCGTEQTQQPVAEKTYDQWKQACLAYMNDYETYKTKVLHLFSLLQTHTISSLSLNVEPIKQKTTPSASEKKSNDSQDKTAEIKTETFSGFFAQSIINKVALKEKDILADFAFDKTVSLPISKKEFSTSRDAFIALMTHQLDEQSNWVHSSKKPFSTEVKTQFKPYVQKCIVPTDATIAVIGDLHGDVEALINTLDYLVKKGILDNTFTLKNNYYLIFLGDYTDRGPCGIEVLYAIFKLKVANPGTVFLLRGNHESTSMNEFPRFFGTELTNKFALTTKEDRRKFIYDVYELLPSALYMGTTNNDYIMFCHGGLDAGFDPAGLIKDPKKIFMSIETLNRKKALETLCSKDSALKPFVNTTFNKDNRDNILPQTTHDLHFLWNDFRKGSTTNDNSSHEVGWEYGELLTQAVLKRDNIKALIRGHNHLLSLSGKGLYSLYDGLVTTVTSFKWHNSSQFFNDYSFLTLSLKPSFANWELWHKSDGLNHPVKIADASKHIAKKTSPIPNTKSSLLGGISL